VKVWWTGRGESIHLPVLVSYVLGVRVEVQLLSGIELGLHLDPLGKELLQSWLESARQLGNEIYGLWGQDFTALGVWRACNLDVSSVASHTCENSLVGVSIDGWRVDGGIRQPNQEYEEAVHTISKLAEKRYKNTFEIIKRP
jgi:hypothetical protein